MALVPQIISFSVSLILCFWPTIWLSKNWPGWL